MLVENIPPACCPSSSSPVVSHEPLTLSRRLILNERQAAPPAVVP